MQRKYYEAVIVGAGFGGMGAAIQLNRLGTDNIAILEREDDLGGTWHVNRYPGLAVDIASFTYSYSLAPNPYWSRMFAPGAELKRYAEHTADTYGLRRSMRFNTVVEGARWDEREQLWTVSVRDGEPLTARYLLTATGVPLATQVPGHTRHGDLPRQGPPQHRLGRLLRPDRPEGRDHRHRRHRRPAHTAGREERHRADRLPAHPDLGHSQNGLDALELAAAVNRGALAPAVAGGWAAGESLLVHADDPKSDGERSGKAIAADRMAIIIACSWPRAELTTLAHRHNPSEPDDLFRAVAACTTNREAARLVVSALEATGVEALALTKPTGYSDQAAAQRMVALLANPRSQLNDVTKAFRIAMRRLYRIRNIILHGGATHGVALEAALRTAAPLLGAGLDRIVHATENIDPLDLAARAEVALQLVHGETGLTTVDLLEPVR
ncbi:NAD(P)-binding protein [Streptomyces sp. TRM70308]|uniref:NAD(P)-binding protein n=1 Tax=Streptomyces sp. TRM70308 TaxID=3131932 RepID=UPI003D08B9C5